ncbi:hypothetical protein BJ508DRAFT_417054 [Ascobolus immersus RN42]|uniref:Uncharacterized protein n=1 Tax=Ascobolus immersus RN42 TaxID=1160509 RepID=A0A3N4HW72_ASCIM|nr:hypothetical protein BJ508DRAFT_417054 [Ascobolus immersus RN42]
MYAPRIVNNNPLRHSDGDGIDPGTGAASISPDARPMLESQQSYNLQQLNRVPLFNLSLAMHSPFTGIQGSPMSSILDHTHQHHRYFGPIVERPIPLELYGMNTGFGYGVDASMVPYAAGMTYFPGSGVPYEYMQLSNLNPSPNFFRQNTRLTMGPPVNNGYIWPTEPAAFLELPNESAPSISSSFTDTDFSDSDAFSQTTFDSYGYQSDYSVSRQQWTTSTSNILDTPHMLQHSIAHMHPTTPHFTSTYQQPYFSGYESQANETDSSVGSLPTRLQRSSGSISRTRTTDVVVGHFQSRRTVGAKSDIPNRICKARNDNQPGGLLTRLNLPPSMLRMPESIQMKACLRVLTEGKAERTRRKFSFSERERMNKTRKAGACYICKFLKKKCCDSGPCRTCVEFYKRHFRAQSLNVLELPCIRLTLLEIRSQNSCFGKVLAKLPWLVNSRAPDESYMSTILKGFYRPGKAPTKTNGTENSALTLIWPYLTEDRNISSKRRMAKGCYFRGHFYAHEAAILSFLDPRNVIKNRSLLTSTVFRNLFFITLFLYKVVAVWEIGSGRQSRNPCRNLQHHSAFLRMSNVLTQLQTFYEQHSPKHICPAKMRSHFLDGIAFGGRRLRYFKPIPIHATTSGVQFWRKNPSTGRNEVLGSVFKIGAQDPSKYSYENLARSGWDRRILKRSLASYTNFNQVQQLKDGGTDTACRKPEGEESDLATWYRDMGRVPRPVAGIGLL